MKGKWTRFGAFAVAAACLVAAVVMVTRGEDQTTGQAWLSIVLIGVVAYLITFVVWPRRLMVERANEKKSAGAQTADTPQPSKQSSTSKRPVVDERPVAVIQPRPAGSRPASRVHVAETPTARSPRGRRVGDRRSSEQDFRWPASR